MLRRALPFPQRAHYSTHGASIIMAHELDTRANGVASYVGRKAAWHQLGTVMDRDVSIAEALALSGADHRVETVPV
jgi:hypothetical protein